VSRDFIHNSNHTDRSIIPDQHLKHYNSSMISLCRQIAWTSCMASVRRRD
jgi:hypothetical protein